jgi:hypothetical protein
MPPRWPRRRGVGGWGVAALLLSVGLLAGAPHASGEGTIPGDDFGEFFTNTTVTPQHAEAVASKQILDLPASTIRVHVFSQHDEGHVYLVGGSEGRESKRPYGRMPDFRVRTLAFGIVPAEVELRVRQVVWGRDVPPPGNRPLGGHIEPWVLSDMSNEPRVQGRVVVQIRSMTLDGRSVDIGRDCGSAHPGGVELAGGEGYNAFYGGILKGTVDIPRLVNCRGMEDLLTAAVSGPDNPLEVKQDKILP